MEEAIEVSEGYGYIRVSTAQQFESGVSLEAQQTKIEEYAKYKNIKLLKIFSDEGISGRTMHKRPAFTEMMDTIRCGQVIITYSLSRLSRSTKDALEIHDILKKKGAHFICLKEEFSTTTAAGRMFFRMMAVINEFEADVIAERTAFAMSKMYENGRAVGKPPYGWMKKDDRQGSGLIPVPEQQEIIEIILNKCEEDDPTGGGKKSLYKVTSEMNREGYEPPKGAKRWYATTIQNIKARAYDVCVKGRPEFDD